MEYATEQGLAYLRSVQQPSGGFIGYSSRTLEPFSGEKAYQTIFTPALILGALADIPQAAGVRESLAAWLYAERSSAWTYTYWAGAAAERQTHPYPDDLDDTFCALSALYRHDRTLVDAAALGEIVQILLAAETQVGGPYRTWLVNAEAPPVWQGVDLVVNANIAYFLRHVAEPLPSITALMDEAIARNAYRSPYYPGQLPVLFFMARAYTGKRTTELLAALRRERPKTPLGYALQCLGLMHLGGHREADAGIKRLLDTQQTDGSWPAAAICLDPSYDGLPYYQGGAALTTAFALDALHRFGADASQKKPKRRVQADTPTHRNIIAAAKQPFASLDTDLRLRMGNLMDYMAKGDTSQEIVLLPQLFASSLAAPTTHIPDAALQQLSQANLYGWMAYTVYDDFLDNEGDPTLLSAANASLRASLDAFDAAIPGNSSFRQLVRDTFNIIDCANAWELAHCRQLVTDTQLALSELPRYGKLERLADRSLGHTLTPLGVLLLAGYRLDDPAVIAVRGSLRHYLIARQLQDDMHDWERDVRAGQINAVVAEIMRDLRLRPGEHAFTRLIPRMLNSFWQRVLPVTCTRVLRHLRAARHAAEASHLIKPGSPFYALYDRLEAATHATRASQAEALAFLQAYKKPPA